MTNIEKYEDAFVQILSIDKDALNDSLTYHSIPSWDSVGHMALMAELEDKFSISMDIEDIIDFSSYDKGREILGKYGVQFD